jgi:hypothetical protein
LFSGPDYVFLATVVDAAAMWLVGTKVLNCILVAAFLRGEMKSRKFQRYARDSYGVLGLVATLSLLRLKVLPGLCDV